MYKGGGCEGDCGYKGGGCEPVVGVKATVGIKVVVVRYGHQDNHRIKEKLSKLYSIKASLCNLTAAHLALIYTFALCTYIRPIVPLGCLIKQSGIIICTTLNLWETSRIKPVPLVSQVYTNQWLYHLSHPAA